VAAMLYAENVKQLFCSVGLKHVTAGLLYVIVILIKLCAFICLNCNNKRN
jgi:hypothetical protein